MFIFQFSFFFLNEHQVLNFGFWLLWFHWIQHKWDYERWKIICIFVTCHYLLSLFWWPTTRWRLNVWSNFHALVNWAQGYIIYIRDTWTLLTSPSWTLLSIFGDSQLQPTYISCLWAGTIALCSKIEKKIQFERKEKKSVAIGTHASYPMRVSLHFYLPPQKLHWEKIHCSLAFWRSKLKPLMKLQVILFWHEKRQCL